MQLTINLEAIGVMVQRGDIVGLAINHALTRPGSRGLANKKTYLELHQMLIHPQTQAQPPEPLV